MESADCVGWKSLQDEGQLKDRGWKLGRESGPPQTQLVLQNWGNRQGGCVLLGGRVGWRRHGRPVSGEGSEADRRLLDGEQPPSCTSGSRFTGSGVHLGPGGSGRERPLPPPGTEGTRSHRQPEVSSRVTLLKTQRFGVASSAQLF